MIFRLLNLLLAGLGITFLVLGRWLGAAIFFGLLLIGFMVWGLRFPEKSS